MERRRFFAPDQPQTLQIAIVLLYLNAAFLVVDMLAGGANLVGLLFALAEAGAAYGIANERRAGYIVGVVVSVLVLAFSVLVMVLYGLLGNILNLLFDGALVALLLHPHSRSYQRIYFR
jgi:hypothetical protein